MVCTTRSKWRLIPVIHYLLQAVCADVILLFKREVSKCLLCSILYYDSLQWRSPQIPDRSICLLFNSGFVWTKGGDRLGQCLEADATQYWWVGREAMQPDSSYHAHLGCACSTKRGWWRRLYYCPKFLCLFLSKQISGCCQEASLLVWHIAKLKDVIWIWSTGCFLLKWHTCFKMPCWNKNISEWIVERHVCVLAPSSQVKFAMSRSD